MKVRCEGGREVSGESVCVLRGERGSDQKGGVVGGRKSPETRSTSPRTGKARSGKAVAMGGTGSGHRERGIRHSAENLADWGRRGTPPGVCRTGVRRQNRALGRHAAES